MNFESAVFNQLDPIRDLINKIYREEVRRIERLWERSLEAVDAISQDLNKYRKGIIVQLTAVPCTSPDDYLFATLRKTVSDKLLQLDINRIKSSIQESPLDFFKSDFKLSDIPYLPSKPLEKPSIVSLPEIADANIFSERTNDPPNSPVS